MSLTLLSFPQVVFKQASAPTAISGGLWYDTDDNELFYSDGFSWTKISSGSDAAGYEQIVSQIILEILRLSAEGTLTAPDYDNMFVDYFSDADGYDGTIDTANTDALFSVDTYSNNGEEIDGHGKTTTSTEARTDHDGFKILTKTACTLQEVTKHASSTATKAYLLDSGKNVLDTKTFSGNVATFDYALADATTYFIVAGKDGASYTASVKGAVSITYPVVCTNVNYTGGLRGASENSTEIDNLVSITTSSGAYIDRSIQTNAQALSFTPAYILVHSKDKTTTSTSSITFDVSFDGESTWDSLDNAIDTKIAVIDGSSKNMIIKLNLNAGASAAQATLKDYEVILWSS